VGDSDGAGATVDHSGHVDTHVFGHRLHRNSVSPIRCGFRW
jgi:hypothetical protein